MTLTHTTPLTAQRAPGRALAVVAAAGAAVALAGLFADPKATWAGVLMAFALATGFAVAGPMFLAIHHLSGARWSLTLTPIAAALTRTLPLAAGLGLVLLAGIPSLYEWSHHEAVAHDALLAHKTPWLNVPFFVIRMAAYFALWIWVGGGLVRAHERGLPHGAMVRRSAVFMAVLGVTYSLACVDWFQSLEPHWFSTIYTLLHIAGAATSALAVVIITTVALRRLGAIRRDDEQLADLGKIAIALSLFWAYVKFCQWMLIWYTNIPEETTWYALRESRGHAAVGIVSLVFNWAVPFFALMPRKCRRTEGVMLRVAIAMLVGRLLDLTVMLTPPLFGPDPVFSVFTAGPIVAAACLFTLGFQRSLRATP